MTLRTASPPPLLAAHRGAVYRLLALAFAYPDPNTDSSLWELVGAFVADPDSPPGLAQRLRGVEDARVPSRQRETLHTRLFDGDMAVSPYESHYYRQAFGKTREMADVAGFYRAFGFGLAEHPRELPDFLATELEFMSLMCLKEAIWLDEGEAGRVEVVRAAQADFLAAHLGRWVPAFCADLRLAAADLASSLYRDLADLLEHKVFGECELMGVRPDPVEPGPAPAPATADPTCDMCPAAVRRDD